MHGFSNGGYFLILGFLSLIGAMSFWFRDVISEGTVQIFSLYILYIYNAPYIYIYIYGDFQAVLYFHSRPQQVLNETNYVLNIAKAVSKEEIKQALFFYKEKKANLKKLAI